MPYGFWKVRFFRYSRLCYSPCRIWAVEQCWKSSRIFHICFFRLRFSPALRVCLEFRIFFQNVVGMWRPPRKDGSKNEPNASRSPRAPLPVRRFRYLFPLWLFLSLSLSISLSLSLSLALSLSLSLFLPSFPLSSSIIYETLKWAMRSQTTFFFRALHQIGHSRVCIRTARFGTFGSGFPGFPRKGPDRNGHNAALGNVR